MHFGPGAGNSVQQLLATHLHMPIISSKFIKPLQLVLGSLRMLLTGYCMTCELPSMVRRSHQNDVAASHGPRKGRHASSYPLTRIALLPAVIVIELKSTSTLQVLKSQRGVALRLLEFALS